MSHLESPVLVVAGVIRRRSDPEKRVLLVRRGPGQSGAGFWEFPGGKVEHQESPEAALIREIAEELSLSVQVQELVGEKDFAYPAKTIRLRVYWAQCEKEDVKLSEHDAMKWCLPQEILVEELSEADRPFVALLF